MIYLQVHRRQVKRLLIPYRLDLPAAPVQIPAPPSSTIVFRQGGVPLAIMDENYIEKGNASTTSADYAPLLTLPQLLTALWAAGAALFMLYHGAAYVSFRRKIRSYCRPVDAAVRERSLNGMKGRGNLQLFICDQIPGPMLAGFMRPVVLLPPADYSDEELNVILKHELTHYRRGDLWFKLLLLTANAIHWFNPLIYVMVRQANRDIEYACDEAVVKNQDLNFRKKYSLTILKSMSPT